MSVYWTTRKKKQWLKWGSIAAVPIIGLSAFMAYWFIRPKNGPNETPPQINLPAPQKPIANPNVKPFATNLLNNAILSSGNFHEEYAYRLLHDNFDEVIDFNGWQDGKQYSLYAGIEGNRLFVEIRDPMDDSDKYMYVYSINNFV